MAITMIYGFLQILIVAPLPAYEPVEEAVGCVGLLSG